MAKWGEGDPRWIVEERPDATNVNNWHWSEKNASVWSKDKIKDLFIGLKLAVPNLGTVTFEEIKCEGEATANNRKGKLIFFYEWVVTCNWTGDVDDDPDKQSKGTIEIPNLSEENECHEVDINVGITSGGETAEKFKEFLRKKGTEEIQKMLEQYLIALRQEYSADLILPTKGSNINNTVIKSKTITVTKKSNINYSVNTTAKNVGNLDLNCKSNTDDIDLHQTFKCKDFELFNVFLIKEMLIAFTRNDVFIEPTEGGKFELFGGNVAGEFVKIVPNKCLVQKWRFKTWPSEHYSIVTLTITEKADCTDLHLSQTGIPINDVDRTRTGWQNYYWESIKRTFGFGAILV